MAEDPTLTEYCLGHLEADRIVVTCEGEMAYALDQVSNGEFATIRSLVRLNTTWGETEDTVIVNCVYVYPYNKFEV